MTIEWTTTDTPIGPFTFIADRDAVLASGWTADVDRLLARVVGGPPRSAISQRTAPSPIVDAVVAYHDGRLDAPSTVAVRQSAGPFTAAAWAALRKVEPGGVISYTDLAARAGSPAAVRAAANACARNPAALFVPCHRAVRRSGGLGGFAWGLDVKRWLLHHEDANRP